MQPLPDQQISSRMKRLAFKHQLGEPQVVYTSRDAPSVSRLFAISSLFISCLIIGLFLYFFTYTNLLNSWSFWQIALILIVGAAWLAIGVWIIFTSLRSRKPSVVVCSEGLMYTRGKRHIIRWEEIMEFWKDIKADREATSSHTYMLRLLDDTTWTFTDDLVNVEELGAIVEDEVMSHLLPRASAAYLAGKPVTFGALILGQWGMSVQSEQEGWRILPWALVQRLHLDETSLSLYKIGEFWAWATLVVSSLPNVGTLKRLAELVLLEHDPNTLSRLIEQYRAGVPVAFGRLRLHLRGVDIIDDKTFIPWNEVAGIGIGESEVIIRRKGESGRWYAIPLALVSNASLLKDFIDYLLSQGREATR